MIISVDLTKTPEEYNIEHFGEFILGPFSNPASAKYALDELKEVLYETRSDRNIK